MAGDHRFRSLVADRWPEIEARLVDDRTAQMFGVRDLRTFEHVVLDNVPTDDAEVHRWVVDRYIDGGIPKIDDLRILAGILRRYLRHRDALGDLDRYRGIDDLEKAVSRLGPPRNLPTGGEVLHRDDRWMLLRRAKGRRGSELVVVHVPTGRHWFIGPDGQARTDRGYPFSAEMVIDQAASAFRSLPDDVFRAVVPRRLFAEMIGDPDLRERIRSLRESRGVSSRRSRSVDRRPTEEIGRFLLENGWDGVDRRRGLAVRWGPGGDVCSLSRAVTTLVREGRVDIREVEDLYRRCRRRRVSRTAGPRSRRD